MKNNLIAACLQLTSSSDIYKNLKETIDLSNKAIDKGAFLISTPEVTNIISLDRQKLKRSVFLEKDDPFLIEFTKIAKKKSVWILLGSIVIKDNKNKLYNRSYLINSKGNIECKYDKIHMFDVKINNKEKHQESSLFQAGNEITYAKIKNIKIGMTICYDLRFPNLYRQLSKKDCSIILVPAAFTRPTGKDHWEVLNRSRAIENNVFIVATGMCGNHHMKRRTYGYSLLVDPWGSIINSTKNKPAIINSTINISDVKKIRKKIPSLKYE